MKHRSDKEFHTSLLGCVLRALLTGSYEPLAGMRCVLRKEDFAASLEACRREALKSFGKDRVLIEKYLVDPRHIELQVRAEGLGRKRLSGPRYWAVDASTIVSKL
jgi:hypothetical protein